MNGHNPVTNSPPKRHLPIAQKQMVYNEWGAIIQHQDEMAKAQRDQEFKQQQHMKNRYRQDLDDQRAEVARKLQQNRLQDHQLANSVLDYQKHKDQQKAMTEDAKKNKIKEDVIRKQKESFEEAEKAKRDYQENRMHAMQEQRYHDQQRVEA